MPRLLPDEEFEGAAPEQDDVSEGSSAESSADVSVSELPCPSPALLQGQ